MIVQVDDEQFQMLSLMIDDTTRGMCIYQAETAKEQRLVADELKNINNKKTIIIDMADYAQNVDEIPIDIQQFKMILDKFPESQVVIVCNLQLCGLWIGDSVYIEKLNYMRDQMMECNKMWVFGMTPYFSILLSQKARDLYTYMMYSCSFVSEEDKDTFVYDRNKEYAGDIKLLISQFEEYKGYIITQMESGEPDSDLVLKTLKVWIACAEYLDYTAVEWVRNLVGRLGDQLLTEQTGGKEIVVYELLSKVFIQLAEYQKALKLITIRMKMTKELFQPDSVEVAEAYEDMAYGYYKADDIQKAKEYFNKSLQVYKRLNKEYSLETINIWTYIAQMYLSQQKYDEAIAIYMRNVQTILEISNESNYGLFEAYNNLGRTYERRGQISEALKYYEKSQELSKKYHSGNVWVEIVALNNISECYHKMGDLDRAKKSLLSAKKNSIQLFGEESEATARIYNNLAAVYCDLGQWVMAERYYQKAIAINEKIFGNGHTTVADAYMNIAMLYVRQTEQNKLVDAYMYAQKAVGIWEGKYPKGHRHIAGAYNLLAILCYKVDDFDNAYTYINKAKQMNIKLYGKDSQSVRDNNYNLELIKEQMLRRDKSK